MDKPTPTAELEQVEHQPTVQPGQIWWRNEDRGFILVERLYEGGRVARIHGCTLVGVRKRGCRSKDAQVWRFNGKPGGYSFVASTSP